jgi:hypothetical protein
MMSPFMRGASVALHPERSRIQGVKRPYQMTLLLPKRTSLAANGNVRSKPRQKAIFKLV